MYKLESADMSGNPTRIGPDAGAPFLHGPPTRLEGDGREEVVLGAIDPGGGYQRSGSEKPAMILHLGQLVNDKVPNVLWNVHRGRFRIVGVHVRNAKRT